MGASWSRSTRSWSGTRWIRSRKIELLHEIARLYEEGGEDGEQAFATYARALREDPAREDTQKRLERLARSLDRWQELVDLYAEVVEQASHDVELQVALWTRIAQIYETQLGRQRRRRRRPTSACSASIRSNLAAANALEAIYLRTDSYQKLVEVVLAKVDMVSEVAREEGAVLQGGADSTWRCWRTRTRPSRSTAASCSIDENDRHGDRRAGAAVHQPRALGRSEGHLRARRPSWPTSIDEKKQMLFVLGQVYDRELKDIDARDRDLPDASWISIPTTSSAIQALDRLYRPGGALVRPAPDPGARGRAVAVHRRDGGRSSTASASCSRPSSRIWCARSSRIARSSSSTAATSRRSRALDGIVHGTEEPVLAAQVLEPIFETAGEWEKLIDVLRGDGPARRGSDAQGRAAAPHRRPTTSGSSSARRRPSRPTAARCAWTRRTTTRC